MQRKKKFKQFFVLGGSAPLNLPVCGGYLPRHPPPGALPPGPKHFWIESSQPNGYQVSLVSISDSGSQKSRKSFGTKNSFRPLLRGGGGGGLQVVNQDRVLLFLRDVWINYIYIYFKIQQLYYFNIYEYIKINPKGKCL